MHRMLTILARNTLLVNCCVRRSTRTFFGHVRENTLTAAEHWSRIKEREEKEFVANDLDGQIVASTERWVREFVIRQNLCPFASKYSRSIHVINLRDDNDGNGVMHSIDHVLHLMAKDQTKIATKLLVFPQKGKLEEWNAFEEFRAFVQMQCMMQGIVGCEIIPFHPKSLRGNTPFDLFSEDSPLHFTVRSPYPTLHLFKVADAEKEIAKWETKHKKTALTLPGPTGDKKVLIDIFQKNAQTLMGMGTRAISKKFQTFYDLTPDVPIHLPAGASGATHSPEQKNAAKNA